MRAQFKEDGMHILMHPNQGVVDRDAIA